MSWLDVLYVQTLVGFESHPMVYFKQFILPTMLLI